MESFVWELWSAAKQAGPFASLLLLVALYVINDERKTALKRNEELVERLFTGLHEAVESVREIRELFYATRDKK